MNVKFDCIIVHSYFCNSVNYPTMMTWSPEQFVSEAMRRAMALADNSIVNVDKVSIMRRPLYYGKYPYTVGLSPAPAYWFKFEWLRDMLLDIKSNDDVLLTNSKTMDFWLFSSDLEHFLRIWEIERYFFVNHIHIVDSISWHLPLPKPKPVTKWYGTYGWRIEFTDRKWLLVPENLEKFDMLSHDFKVVTHPRSFLYLTKLSDVIVIKLIWAECIQNIVDRSHL